MKRKQLTPNAHQNVALFMSHFEGHELLKLPPYRGIYLSLRSARRVLHITTE